MTDDRTEEALRRALHDAASRVNVPMGTLPDPAPEPSTVARRRADLRVPAIVTLVLVIVAGSIALVATRGGNDPARITASGAAGDPITRENADIQLVMDANATDEQIAAVRDFAEQAPEIAAYTVVSPEDSLAEFQAENACTSTPISPTAASYPVMIRFRLATGTDDQSLNRALAALPGVIQATARSSDGTYVIQNAGGPTSVTDAPPSTTITPNITSSATPTTVADANSNEATTTTSPQEASTADEAPTTVPAPVSKEIPFVAPTPPDCTDTSTGLRVPEPTPNQATAATLPPAGEQPADATNAEQAVRDMWNLAFSATTPDAERYALYENYATHPELYGNGLPQNQQFRDNLAVKVLDIVFVSPTEAAVRYQLDFPALHVTEPADIGHAVLTADGWKVSTDTMCGLLAKGGRQCPAS